MTAPDKDTLATYGGALQDAAPVIDGSTDMAAASGNQAMASTAANTRTGIRCWCSFNWNGTSVTLVNHEEMWGGGPGNAAPIPAHTGTGVMTLTYPATVNDEIPNNMPGGGNNPHTLNLRAGWGQEQSGTNRPKVVATSANVLTVTLETVADPSNVVYDIFGI